MGRGNVAQSSISADGHRQTWTKSPIDDAYQASAAPIKTSDICQRGKGASFPRPPVTPKQDTVDCSDSAPYFVHSKPSPRCPFLSSVLTGLSVVQTPPETGFFLTSKGLRQPHPPVRIIIISGDSNSMQALRLGHMAGLRPDQVFRGEDRYPPSMRSKAGKLLGTLVESHTPEDASPTSTAPYTKYMKKRVSGYGDNRRHGDSNHDEAATSTTPEFLELENPNSARKRTPRPSSRETGIHVYSPPYSSGFLV
ncbi:predicted protein [Coccidioides posadasii C735 delta SOWgp]|uniref:Uncharacterized protein n=1 Tax=Coccidioides posadasii (strain C735) TaxID=222929 RepID=C5P314_COCP7|nr:predicted protein [Coccidioides posadasii C735 delta SOWgp]EER28702.1 predicted protein [Coccidioides posadasii C735 delta SOWgp]|eukprot:XP_003070847.1 predicted protein [Coccidioides posadasii C735 delta SOWgp]